MMSVARNSVVSLRYIMKSEAGGELENTRQSNPVSYLHGATAIHPVLQAQLEGLEAGDTKRIYLDAATAVSLPVLVFEVIIDNIRAAMPEELALGYPVQLPVKHCEAGCDCYVQGEQKK